MWSVNCLLCWKTKWRICPLGWGELSGCSSCAWGLRSLLYTEGFWLCQCFCWVMDLWCRREVLLLLNGVWCCFPLSIIVKSLSSNFGYFVEMWWFLVALVVWFRLSETCSFRDLLVSPIYSVVQLLAGHF